MKHNYHIALQLELEFKKSSLYNIIMGYNQPLTKKLYSNIECLNSKDINIEHIPLPILFRSSNNLYIHQHNMLIAIMAKIHLSLPAIIKKRTKRIAKLFFIKYQFAMKYGAEYAKLPHDIHLYILSYI